MSKMLKILLLLFIVLSLTGLSFGEQNDPEGTDGPAFINVNGVLQPNFKSKAYKQSVTYKYYHHDAQGNVRAVTDEKGNAIERHDVHPYGETITPAPTEDKYLYSGKKRDAETGFDYFGARFYSSQINRWMSADPLSFQKQSMKNPQNWNLFAYCNNDPINRYDPDGRLVVKGSKTNINLFQDLVLTQTGYKTKVSSTGLVSIDGARNTSIGKTAIANEFLTSVGLKSKVTFDLEQKQTYLVDKWTGQGSAKVDVGDLTSSKSAKHTEWAGMGLLHVLSEQNYAVKNKANLKSSHKHAIKVTGALWGATSRKLSLAKNRQVKIDFFDNKNKLVKNFTLVLDANLTPTAK